LRPAPEQLYASAIHDVVLGIHLCSIVSLHVILMSHEKSNPNFTAQLQRMLMYLSLMLPAFPQRRCSVLYHEPVAGVNVLQLAHAAAACTGIRGNRWR
jgi:hypothetical protein